MASYTLLDMTKMILSSIDGDEVTSINDTVESQQVVDVIRQCFETLVEEGNLPISYDLFELVPSGDPTLPVVMTKPTTVESLEWIRYNRKKAGSPLSDWEEIEYLEPEDFVTNSFGQTQDNTVTQMNIPKGSDTIELFILNNVGPRFWTSFDDQTIVFDAYDAAVDTTGLQKSKTLAYGRKKSLFQASDTFVFPLNSQEQLLLLNEAKAMAWADIKQSVNAKAEKKARQGWIRMQKYKRSTPPDDMEGYPYYGRK